MTFGRYNKPFVSVSWFQNKKLDRSGAWLTMKHSLVNTILYISLICFQYTCLSYADNFKHKNILHVYSDGLIIDKTLTYLVIIPPPRQMNFFSGGGGILASPCPCQSVCPLSEDMIFSTHVLKDRCMGFSEN